MIYRLSETFNLQESQPLKQYLQSIANLGTDVSTIDNRSKLAKIILIWLREAPIKSHVTYRISVDPTLPLFKTQ